MTDNAKRKVLSFFLLAMILIVLIAAALPQLELKPGIPLPRTENGSGASQVEPAPLLSMSVSTLFKALLSVILVLVVAYGIYKLLRRAPWKEILRHMLIITLLTLVALGIFFLLGNVQITLDQNAPEVLPPDINITGPPLSPLPPALIWLVWIGLGMVIILLGIWLVKGRTKINPASDALELEAERGMKALETGIDFKNVIVRCFLQMSLALQKEEGIKLEETMTAREFERLLEARGIPHDPVHQLTQLFESARYSCQQPAPGAGQKAINCLNVIVRYCHERKQPG
jgi:hypothetical protein